MPLKFIEGKKKLIFCLSLILLMFLQYEFIIPGAQGRKETVFGYQNHDFINPNETVSYNFTNSNVNFEIFSNKMVELNIEYDPAITGRQTKFIINSSDSIILNITSKTNINSFGLPNLPNDPSKGHYRFQYQYNCIYKIRSNQTIENLTVQHAKNSQYGLNPNKRYSLAVFKAGSESWEVLDTSEKENVSSLEMYLESSILNISSTTDYYITIYEITDIPYDWTWLFILISIGAIFGVLSLAILISKKDYFQYLRTRMVYVEKGAHRLSLEQVLENENRGKIIDLILKKPGIHFNELLREMDIAAGNLVWHLDILETYKVVGKKRIGNFVAYFPYYQKNPISNVDLKLQKSKLTLEILEMIEREPGIWNNFITKKMKVDHKTIQYHIDKLIELDLINFKKEGRKKKIYPNFDSEYYNKNKDNNI